jgi:hypothetical protein
MCVCARVQLGCLRKYVGLYTHANYLGSNSCYKILPLFIRIEPWFKKCIVLLGNKMSK